MPNHILPNMFNDNAEWVSINNATQMILDNNNQLLKNEDIKKIINSISKLKNGSQEIYNGIKETMSSHLKNKVLYDILCSLNKNFLEKLIECWANHKQSIGKLKEMMMSMDMYLKINNLKPVDEVGMSLFVDIIVKDNLINDPLREELMNIVLKVRNLEETNRKALKDACQMLLDQTLTDEHIYEEIFERPFLARSREFYFYKSHQLLSEHGAHCYFDSARRYKNTERVLAITCMTIKTVDCLIDILEDELIVKHIKTIAEMDRKCKTSIELDIVCKTLHINDVKYIFDNFKIKKFSVNILSKCLNKYLVEQLEIVEKNCKKNFNPVTYVQRLLDVNNELDCLQFCPKFKINDKMVLKETTISTFKRFIYLHKKFPEYLSLFIDQNLRRNNWSGSKKCKTKTPILDQVVVLFQFLQDSDVFKKYYEQHLITRLLSNCFNEDNEKNMISNLKTQFGSQFTDKFEEMVKDMARSNNIMDSFKINLTAQQSLNCTNIDLSVCVLNTEFWTLPASSPKCIIPNIAYLPFEEFKTFYLSKHYNRQLRIQPQLGSAEIIFNKNYMTTRNVHTNLLQVSTYQMIILMLFNSFNKITMETIMKKTEINENDLTRELQSLATGKLSQKVLLKSPDIKEIKPHDEFSINELFSCVKIQLIPTKEEENEPEMQKIKDKTEESRKHEIEAALMRILKAHRRLSLNDLIIKVTDMLRPRFMSSPMLINKCIEQLIERGFLSRSPETKLLINYNSDA